jgi:acyl dehydratase
MNTRIDELFPGQEETIRKIFSDADVRSFAELCGDTNPIHLDEEYALNSFFQQRIVHGFLYGSLISTILGTKLPGPGSIYIHQEMVFKKPVFLNEEVMAVVKIIDINKEKSLISLSTCCFKGESVLVLDGKATVKLI